MAIAFKKTFNISSDCAQFNLGSDTFILEDLQNLTRCFVQLIVYLCFYLF